MNKIVISLLAGFAGGVMMRSFWDFGWGFALLFVFLGLIMAGIFLILKFPKFVLFAGLFFLAFGLGVLRYEIKETRNAVFENQVSQKITLEGTIIDEPNEKESYTWLAIEENKIKAKILIVSRRYPEFHYGDKVEVNGILQKPQKTSGSNFDWPAYLAKDDIYYEIIYPQIKLLPGSGGSWIKRQLFGVKEKFIENISTIVPEPDASYLAGLTIGGKKAMPKDLQDEFRRAGIIHIVVLSGYNVTIVADTIMRILKFLPLPQFFGIGFGILGIFLFALMTGASATVVRASLMAVIALMARATGRIYYITTALLVAGFFMLLQNPKILRFDASFQLSFLSTLALIFISPIIEKKLGFVPRKFGLRGVASSTISTQIFVLPFLLYQMGIFSVVALPVNLLVLIFVPVTMLFGFLSGGIGFIAHILSVPFGWLAYAFSAYELWIVNIFSKLSFAAFNVPISFWSMILIYAGYAVLLYKLIRNKKNAVAENPF